MIKQTPEQCACRVVEDATLAIQLTPSDLIIEYCPLHEAAPELLKDLRFIHMIAKAARNSDASWRDLETVTANAIAKAEGRS